MRVWRRGISGNVERAYQSGYAEMLEDLFYGGGYEEAGAVLRLEDALGDGVIEEVEQAVVEAVDVE